MANLITWLLSIRRTYGAHSTIGRYVSNLDELEQNKRKAKTPEQLQQLVENEKLQWKGLGTALRARSTLRQGNQP